MLKRVAVLLLCLMMVFLATFSFIVGVVAVPTIYSYADTNSNEIYIPLRDQSDLVKAFQAYCKSRDLTIDGSVADAVTKFTTGAFNGVCNTLGINISQLQAELQAEYDQSGEPVKFLFNSTGVMAMNRIFAQFLQDNELQVGSPADKTLYSGQYGTDLNGNGFLFYVIPVNPVSGRNYKPIVHGSTYIYNNQTMIDLAIQNNDRYKFNPFGSGSNNYLLIAKSYNQWRLSNASYVEKYISGSNSNIAYAGNLAIAYVNGYTSDIRIGVYTSADDYFYDFGTISVAQQQSVNITVVSNNINNNIYEGDTIINNEGDIINNPGDDPDNPDDPDPPGGTSPGWDIGGGDGTVDDGNGNTWNIKFPDFELPDLNIDWQIHGLGDKFPFSIPFDLVALVTVLNAEPEAPRFEGTVNFGFTTWDYDINLEQFNNVASACRIAEILLLVFGLILVTRSIIKG